MCIPLLFFGSSKFLNKEIESSILNTLRSSRFPFPKIRDGFHGRNIPASPGFQGSLTHIIPHKKQESFVSAAYKKQRVRLGQCSNTKNKTHPILQTRCMGQIGRTVGHRFSCLLQSCSAVNVSNSTVMSSFEAMSPPYTGYKSITTLPETKSSHLTIGEGSLPAFHV